MEPSCWVESMMTFAPIRGGVGIEMKWGMGERILINTLFGKLLNLMFSRDAKVSSNFFDCNIA